MDRFDKRVFEQGRTALGLVPGAAASFAAEHGPSAAEREHGIREGCGIDAMGAWSVLLLRLLLAVILSLMLSYLFFETMSVMRVGGLAVALLGFAYLFEYTKQRDKGGGNGI